MFSRSEVITAQSGSCALPTVSNETTSFGIFPRMKSRPIIRTCTGEGGLSARTIRCLGFCQVGVVEIDGVSRQLVLGGRILLGLRRAAPWTPFSRRSLLGGTKRRKGLPSSALKASETDMVLDFPDLNKRFNVIGSFQDLPYNFA